MSDPCPSLEDRLESRLDPALRDRLLVHASECVDCRDRLDLVQEAVAGAVPRPRRLGPVSWMTAAAAAAVALAAGGAFLRLRAPSGAAVLAARFTLPAGERLGTMSGEIAAGAQAARSLSLPDGSRLRLEPGARLRFEPPVEEERVHIHILSGALETEVAPGKGQFRVSAAAGEVRVLGTRFRTKAFNLGGDLPCLCVEVYEGKVSVQNGAGALPVFAGERAAIAGSRAPAKQGIGGSREEMLRSYAASKDRAQADLLAAFLLGSRWERPVDWEPAAEDPGVILQAKRIFKELDR